MAKSALSLKLLIDTKGKRVLFAEAKKDSVDFLFHILSLPVATVVSLLKEQGMVGSLANLYESIENLNETYIQPNQSKDTLLKPVRLAQGSSVPVLLPKDEPSEKQFYTCSRCAAYNTNVGFVSDDPHSVCPSCGQNMTTAVPYVAPPAAKQAPEGGFVKGMVTYMVMDNLVVKPMSSISCITLLNKFNVKELSSLEEREMNLGMNEAVSLLNASLHSQTVLTDVFLKHHMPIEETDVGMEDNLSVT